MTRLIATSSALRSEKTARAVLPLMPVPSSERNLADRLAGKRVCIAIDDADFSRLHEVVEVMLGHTRNSAKVSIVPWSELVSSLADRKNDIVLILSPRKLAEDFDRFETGLRAFKERNPESVIVMNNLHSPLSLQTALVQTLKDASLVDHIEQGFAFFPVLLQYGAERLEAKI